MSGMGIRGVRRKKGSREKDCRRGTRHCALDWWFWRGNGWRFGIFSTLVDFFRQTLSPYGVLSISISTFLEE